MKKPVAKKVTPAKKTVRKTAASKKPVSKKPISKKTVAKKVPAKKVVAKKAVGAKKPTAKKTAAKKTASKTAVSKKAVSKKTIKPVAKKIVAKKVVAETTKREDTAVDTLVVVKIKAPKKPVAVQPPVTPTPVVKKAVISTPRPAKKQNPPVDAPAESVETQVVARPPQADATYSADPILLQRILTSLDDDKAEEIMTIDLEGRSSLCDAIVVASGRSSRHVSSIAEHLARRLKEAGYGTRPVNGAGQGDWALVDAGDVIVHIFRPEVRSYYDLEGMWSVDESRIAK